MSSLNLAEAVRFELTEPRGSPVFKTGGLNHSPTLPKLYEDSPVTRIDIRNYRSTYNPSNP